MNALLLLIGKLLKGVPWPVWAFLAVVGAFYLYGEHKERLGLKHGKQQIQVQWDAAVERGKQEIARIDRENAAKDERARLKAQHIGEQRERDQADELAERNRVIAGLRNGTVRLRQQWQGCLSHAQASGTAGVPGGPVPADPLRTADALDLAGAVGGSLFIADDADSKVNRLLQYVDTLTAQCRG